MAKEINDNFVEDSRAEHALDAVHPRFQPESEAEALKYQREHYYYCEQCSLFFAPSVTALNIHFRKPVKAHRSCGSCFYCKGEVFQYTINGSPRVYHTCPRKSS